MIRTESVLLSSDVSKDGTQFSIKSLEDALSLAALYGNPSCLGHDSTQPIGWITPFGLYFEPGLCRVTGKGLLAETEEDQKIINEAFTRRLRKLYNEDCGPFLDKFNASLKKYYTGNQKFLSSTLVSCIDKDIVIKFFPKLFERLDKNGLIYLDDLLKLFEYKGHGVFKDKSSEFAICAHQYFRRSLSVHNNLNYFFLDHLLRLQGQKDVVLRLRIDADRIGIAETFMPAMEFEYWHGPKFTEDIPEIKNEVTVHGMDEHNRMFNGIERTEFYRKIESDQQTFEIEEIKARPSLGISSTDFGCRYIHSQFDISSKNFKHFDGAIRMYDQDKMDVRSQKNIKNAGKDSIYTKLFRIDGQLPMEQWKGLIYNYFQGNNLIEEYFTGQPAPIPSLLTEELTGTTNSILPLQLKTEDGLRIAVSYTSAEDIDFEEHSHFLLGYDELEENRSDESDQYRKVVEADVIDLRKELSKLGYSLEIPDQVEFIDCEKTMIWNVPAILIRNDVNISNYISAMLQALYNILNSPKYIKETISFTVKWKRDNDILVGVSVIGNKSTICKWIERNLTIPTAHDKFRDWIEAQHAYLSDFKVDIDNPKLFSVLNTDGVLYIKRENLGKYCDLDTFEILPDGRFNVVIKNEFKELFSEFASRLQVAEVLILKRSSCTGCGSDYRGCNHSRITDDVTQKIDEYERAGFCLV